MKRWCAIALISAAGWLPTAGVSAEKSKPLTRSEYMAMASRIYPNVSADKLLDAAESVLRKTASDEFSIVFEPDAILAKRFYTSAFYLIAAQRAADTWRIKATDKAEGGQIALSIGQDRSSQSATPVLGGNLQITGGTITGSTYDSAFVASPALFDLFFARLDHELKLSSNWPSCVEQEQRAKKNNLQGTLDPLCGGFAIKKDTDATGVKKSGCSGDEPVRLNDEKGVFLKCISDEEAQEMRSRSRF